jgi:hypothetical protein
MELNIFQYKVFLLPLGPEIIPLGPEVIEYQKKKNNDILNGR